MLELLLEKEKEERESKSKADIQARYYDIGSNKKRLKLSNVGLASACNVRLTFDEESGVTLIPNDVESKFPIDVLEPKNSVDLMVADYPETPRKHSINVEWEDGFKTDNYKSIPPYTVKLIRLVHISFLEGINFMNQTLDYVETDRANAIVHISSSNSSGIPLLPVFYVFEAFIYI